MLVFKDYDPNIDLNRLSTFPIPKLDAPSSLKSFPLHLILIIYNLGLDLHLT